MTDPFRGELTAKYVQQENLAWAENERLARQARLAVAETKLGSLGPKLHISRLLNALPHRHGRPHSLTRPQMAH